VPKNRQHRKHLEAPSPERPQYVWIGWVPVTKAIQAWLREHRPDLLAGNAMDSLELVLASMQPEHLEAVRADDAGYSRAPGTPWGEVEVLCGAILDPDWAQSLPGESLEEYLMRMVGWYMRYRYVLRPMDDRRHEGEDAL
jgi:hypothetical protein